ncbi:MAG: hypothetical protein ABL921_07675 [Pirellula sp.]
MSKLSLCLIAWVTCCSAIRAEFVFTVGNGNGLLNSIQVTAGSTVLVPIYGHFAGTGSTFEAAAYDLIGAQAAFDFQPFGVGAGVDSNGFPSLAGITAVLPPVVLGGGITFNSAVPGSPATSNWDKRFIANFNANVDMTNSPQRLFDLSFTVPITATSGIYGINIVPAPTVPTNGTLASMLQTGTGTPAGFFGPGVGSLGAISSLNGSIEITAVPEPSSIVFACVLSVGMTGYLVRKRRAAKAKAAVTDLR